MDTVKYKLFMLTAERSSLSLAAAELGYSQSAGSHMLNTLEQELGFSLLIRSRAGVRLTDAGTRLLPRVREMLAAEERLQQTAADILGMDEGTVRVGSFTSVATHWLPGIIKSFGEKYPRIRFQLLNGDYYDVDQWLKEGKIDIGFVRLPAPEGCEVIPLAADRLLAVLPEDHRFAGRESYPLSEIGRDDFISLRASSAQDAMDAIRGAGAKAKIRYTTTDDYAIIAMVRQGLGISILPELLLEGHRDGIRTLELDPPSSRTIALAYRADAAGPAAEKLKEHILQYLSSARDTAKRENGSRE